MSPEAVRVTGLILLTVPTIQFGGYTLLRFLSSRAAGYMDNPLRRGMFTAGHAHAGVIVILALIFQPLVDQTTMNPALQWFVRLGTPTAAILMPAGFFLSVYRPDAQRPNGLIRLIYGGALLLMVSVIVLGIGLLTAAG